MDVDDLSSFSIFESFDSTDICCFKLALVFGGVSDLLRIDCMGLLLVGIVIVISLLFPSIDTPLTLDSSVFCNKSGKSTVRALMPKIFDLALSEEAATGELVTELCTLTLVAAAADLPVADLLSTFSKLAEDLIPYKFLGIMLFMLIRGEILTLLYQ